ADSIFSLFPKPDVQREQNSFSLKMLELNHCPKLYSGFFKRFSSKDNRSECTQVFREEPWFSYCRHGELRPQRYTNPSAARIDGLSRNFKLFLLPLREALTSVSPLLRNPACVGFWGDSPVA